MPVSAKSVTSHGYAADHCRAKNPATCRVHGAVATADTYLTQRAAGTLTVPAVRQRLTRGFAGSLSIVESRITNTLPTYVAGGGLSQRMRQFDERLDAAAADIVTAVQRARLTDETVDSELIRGQLAHHINPVIGWLHSDLDTLIPTYRSGELRSLVDALKARMADLCQEIAERDI